MRFKTTLFVLALTMLLSACGDGGGSVASTPAPPSSPTYQKVADLTGNQTIQSGGVHWTAGSGGITGQSVLPFGGGLVFSYSAATDTFTVTAPTGANATFTSADLVAAQSTATTRVFSKNGSAQQFVLAAQTINGVALSYVQFGQFLNASGSTADVWNGVGGVPTVASDMPKSGSATYTAETGAAVIVGTVQNNTTAASTATFTANWGTGSVATSVHLVAAPTGGVATDFGTFNGTGTISAGGPGFTGSFAGTTGAGFSGAFFGPAAQEMGYTYNFKSGTAEAFGAVRGLKQ